MAYRRMLLPWSERGKAHDACRMLDANAARDEQILELYPKLAFPLTKTDYAWSPPW